MIALECLELVGVSVVLGCDRVVTSSLHETWHLRYERNVDVRFGHHTSGGLEEALEVVLLVTEGVQPAQVPVLRVSSLTRAEWSLVLTVGVNWIRMVVTMCTLSMSTVRVSMI